jgi:hypothetical protein
MTALARRVDSTLVALTQQDVAPAQMNLVAWCRGKLEALGLELREHRQNLRHAQQAKWATKPWTSQISKTKARMVYYAKIMAAVNAGYLIIPNFDLDVFAVRTTRRTPAQKWDRTRAQPDLAPHGRGEYVDDIVFSDTVTTPATQNSREHSKELPTRFDYVPDIPLRGVKPIILDATRRAMALKIFDQIGVVKNRKQDPIIVGQIIRPGGNDYHWKKTICFFVAWWLDPETL